MVDRLEGIDRMQSSNEIKLVEKNKTERKRTESNKNQRNNPTNSKDELSAEEMRENLEEKIEDMNSITETLKEQLTFKLHDATERMMVQVIDLKTDEVLKEMPPEEMLDLAARIDEMVGLIIDEKV